MRDRLQKEWQVIRQAPLAYVITVVVVGVVEWAAINQFYSVGRSYRDDQIDSLKGTVARLEAKVKESESTSKSPPEDHRRNEFPTAVVGSIWPTVISGMPVVQAGKRTSISVGVINNGPQFARDVQWDARLFLVRPPSSNAEERLFLDEVLGDLAAGLELRDKVTLDPTRFAYLTPEIDIDDVRARAIENETLRLYVLTSFKWRDSTGVHESNSCVWLQRPRPIDEKPVWHFCASQTD